MDIFPSYFDTHNMHYSDAQDTEQVYRGATAECYRGFRDCDRNVYDWTRTQLTLENVAGRIVVDAGCGKAPFFPALERSGVRQMIGIDGSEEMLGAIPVHPDEQRLQWPIDPSVLATSLGKRKQLLIHANLHDALRALEGTADMVLSTFNLVCFSNPREPIDHIRSALKPGGRFVAVTNAFAPHDAALLARQAQDGLAIDLHAMGCSQPDIGDTVFRQVLHLEGADLPLQDNAETLATYADALPPSAWSDVQATLFVPQGCTLVDPGDETSAHRHLFPPGAFSATRTVFSPIRDERFRAFRYVKLCILATKRW